MKKRSDPEYMQTATLQTWRDGVARNSHWFGARRVRHDCYVVHTNTRRSPAHPPEQTRSHGTHTYNQTLLLLERFEAEIEREAQLNKADATLACETAFAAGTHYSLFFPAPEEAGPGKKKGLLSRIASAAFRYLVEEESLTLPYAMRGTGLIQRHILAGSPGCTYYRAVHMSDGWTIQRITADMQGIPAHTGIMAHALGEKAMFTHMLMFEELQNQNAFGNARLEPTDQIPNHFLRHMHSLASALYNGPPSTFEGPVRGQPRDAAPVADQPGRLTKWMSRLRMI